MSQSATSDLSTLQLEQFLRHLVGRLAEIGNPDAAEVTAFQLMLGDVFVDLKSRAFHGDEQARQVVAEFNDWWERTQKEWDEL